MFAKGSRPNNNRAQNKQFDQACKQCGVRDKTLRRQIHEALHGEPPMGWHELIEFIKSFIGK
jgi:hypothetical protein